MTCGHVNSVLTEILRKLSIGKTYRAFLCENISNQYFCELVL